jgi:hypothetical protein
MGMVGSLASDHDRQQCDMVCSGSLVGGIGDTGSYPRQRNCSCLELVAIYDLVEAAERPFPLRGMSSILAVMSDQGPAGGNG